MKKSALLVCLLLLAGSMVLAQVPADSGSMPASSAAAVPMFTTDELDQLLGPIALYPDPLIALMLPASTEPAEIVLAARYFRSGGDPADVEAQPWPESVRALAHYPEVITWMDDNLAWTQQLGEAFLNEPTEVMNAIQRLRQRARAAGTLGSTPQQQVLDVNGTIYILPAQPNVLYVPYYDPGTVYFAHPGYYGYSRYFNFSAGFATGWWLSYGVDWGQSCIWTVHHGDRERYWREHHDWRDRWHLRPGHRPGPPPESHRWEPRAGHPHGFVRGELNRGFDRDRRDGEPRDQRRDRDHRDSPGDVARQAGHPGGNHTGSPATLPFAGRLPVNAGPTIGREPPRPWRAYRPPSGMAGDRDAASRFRREEPRRGPGPDPDRAREQNRAFVGPTAPASVPAQHPLPIVTGPRFAPVSSPRFAPPAERRFAPESRPHFPAPRPMPPPRTFSPPPQQPRYTPPPQARYSPPPPPRPAPPMHFAPAAPPPSAPASRPAPERGNDRHEAER